MSSTLRSGYCECMADCRTIQQVVDRTMTSIGCRDPASPDIDFVDRIGRMHGNHSSEMNWDRIWEIEEVLIFYVLSVCLTSVPVECAQAIIEGLKHYYLDGTPLGEEEFECISAISTFGGMCLNYFYLKHLPEMYLAKKTQLTEQVEGVLCRILLHFMDDPDQFMKLLQPIEGDF